LLSYFNLDVEVLASSYRSPGPQKYISYYKGMIRVGQPLAAEMKLTEGIMRFPKSVELVIARATVRNDHMKKYDEALFDYNMAIRMSRGAHPKLYFRTGDIYYYKGMYRTSIGEYTKCLKAIPTYGKVYFKRAKAYVKIGEKEKARVDLRKCQTFSPKYRKHVLKFMIDNHL
jgi:tetratricopeptide (TPR) repeat protein